MFILLLLFYYPFYLYTISLFYHSSDFFYFTLQAPLKYSTIRLNELNCIRIRLYKGDKIMINFLDLNRTINFYDKKIMKFILDNNEFKNQKIFNCSIVNLKNKTNLFSNDEIFNILNDFKNLNISYNIITSNSE